MEQHKSWRKNIKLIFIAPSKNLKKLKIRAILKVRHKSFSGKHIPSYYRIFKVVFLKRIM